MDQPDNTLTIDKTMHLPRFPITLLSFSLFITIVSLIWLGSYEHTATKRMQHLINYDMKSLEQRERMLYLNEDARMKARIAIFTNDKKLEEEYELSHPLYDNAAKEASAFLPSLYTETARQLDLSDDGISALEAEAFKLLNAGKSAAAKEMLSSPQYKEQQNTYQQAMDKYIQLEHQESQEHLRQKIHETHNIYVIIITCLSFLLAAWFFTYKNFIRWKKIKTNEQRLEELLYLDQVTGVYNRAFFSKNLSYAIAEAEQHRNTLAVIHIDIDRFGQININHDHKVGDQLLHSLATRLQDWVDDTKQLARVGGDEFAILLSDFSQIRHIETFLLELSNALKQPFVIDGNPFHISTSMGVSIYPNHADNHDTLMNFANLALTHCKKQGGANYQIYYPNLSKTANTQWALEEELHVALERQEFRTFYQPIVNAQDGKIIGAEALLRWQHPKHGLLNPDAFVPACEATGLIVPIGAWMLQSACEQVRRWHALGYTDLSIAVNLSARQFNYPGLLELVTNTLAATNIPPTCLKLEITESLVMQDAEANIALLKSLRNLGLQLSLDDFGTGYSSLSYLRQFPVNILKIDKSFITDLTSQHSNHAIVEAIIALGKSLNLTLIAEGIETQQQADILKTMQCDLLQGYLYSKPIPAEEFTQLLLAHP